MGGRRRCQPDAQDSTRHGTGRCGQHVCRLKIDHVLSCLPAKSASDSVGGFRAQLCQTQAGCKQRNGQGGGFGRPSRFILGNPRIGACWW